MTLPFSRLQSISRFVLCSCVVGALALTVGARQGAAQAQRADPAMMKRGSMLFQQRGCAVCHTIGRSNGAHTAEGPDLAGVTDRRTAEWLHDWLKDPDAMFGSDPVADEMLKQYHYVKMPNMHLSESDIAAITAYLSQHH